MNEEESYTIYCHQNIITNQSYIGKTCKNPYYKRWTSSGTPYKECSRFQEAIDKYGWDNFKHFIIKDNLTSKEADYYEKFLIELFKTNDINYGYNLASYNLSEETKKKIKENHADFKKENHPNWGKKHSKESIVRMKIAAQNRILSEESKQNKKKKLSIRFSGFNNPRAKKVLCINTGAVFLTAKEAAKWANVDNSCLCKCCNGHRNTAGKDPVTKEPLKWMYIGEEE